MSREKKPKIEVRDGDKWIRVWKSAELKQLKDGTNAFALPGEWREVE